MYTWTCFGNYLWYLFESEIIAGLPFRWKPPSTGLSGNRRKTHQTNEMKTSLSIFSSTYGHTYIHTQMGGVHNMKTYTRTCIWMVYMLTASTQSIVDLIIVTSCGVAVVFEWLGAFLVGWWDTFVVVVVCRRRIGSVFWVVLWVVRGGQCENNSRAYFASTR